MSNPLNTIAKERSEMIEMKKMNKDDIFTSAAIAILLFTAMINWNIYSWLILLGIILILTAFYFKKQ